MILLSCDPTRSPYLARRKETGNGEGRHRDIGIVRYLSRDAGSVPRGAHAQPLLHTWDTSYVDDVRLAPRTSSNSVSCGSC